MRARRKKTTSKIALVALTLLLLVALSSVAKSFEFVSVDPLVWLKTENKVNQGSYFYQIKYMPVSPCSAFNQAEPGEQDVQSKIYRGLKIECENSYSKYVGEILKLLQDRAKAGNTKTRHKRFDPITISLVALITVVFVAVGWLGNMAYEYWSPNSASNQIVKVKEELSTVKDDMKKMKAAILEAGAIRTEMIDLIGNLSLKVTSNKNAISHLATIIPVATNQMVDAKDVIRAEAKLLKNILNEARVDRASPDEYAEWVL